MNPSLLLLLTLGIGCAVGLGAVAFLRRRGALTKAYRGNPFLAAVCASFGAFAAAPLVHAVGWDLPGDPAALAAAGAGAAVAAALYASDLALASAIERAFDEVDRQVIMAWKSKIVIEWSRLGESRNGPSLGREDGGEGGRRSEI